VALEIAGDTGQVAPHLARAGPAVAAAVEKEILLSTETGVTHVLGEQA